jgi:hypothetical protein
MLEMHVHEVDHDGQSHLDSPVWIGMNRVGLLNELLRIYIFDRCCMTEAVINTEQAAEIIRALVEYAPNWQQTGDAA